jgi:hypothetical protein
MSKLKPCPICGSEANTRCEWGLTCSEYGVGCSNEDCLLAYTICGRKRYATEVKAIEAWNTRHERADVAQVTHCCPCGAQRTCRPKDTWYSFLSDTDCLAWECSECGELFEAHANYCSNCGAKVVQE